MNQCEGSCSFLVEELYRWIKADFCVQSEVTEQLMKEANLDSLEEWQKYVAVLLKDSIMYSKSDSRIV